MATRKVIGVRAAAIHFGFSMKHIYELLYLGKLRAEKVGRQWQIDPAAIREFEQRRAQQKTSA